MMSRLGRVLLIGIACFVGSLGVAGCESATKTCTHDAYVKTTVISANFTGAEVEYDARWTSQGTNGTCFGSAVKNIHRTASRCYRNAFIDGMLPDHCQRSDINDFNPVSAIGEIRGAFGWHHIDSSIGSFHIDGDVMTNRGSMNASMACHHQGAFHKDHKIKCKGHQLG